jgi:hypothetical protein
MQEKYNSDYYTEAVKAFTDSVKQADKIARYSIGVENGLADPPVLHMLRFMGDTGDLNKQSEIAHYCILKRMITVYLDDKSVGSFQFNSIDDPWESSPVIVEHPLAFSEILNLATGHVIKKYLPHLKNTP